MVRVNEIEARNYVTKSKLPGTDYVINPYVGCPHKCIYCYAEFMKKFSNHQEEWGDFLDVKRCTTPIKVDKHTGKSIVISSVTDPYNPYEKRYMITRSILEQLAETDADIGIITKSHLVVRDVDILKKLSNCHVAMSMCSTDEAFRAEVEPFASSYENRVKALKRLHDEGIRTVLFMSPIFPGITDFVEIIDRTRDYVDSYWFENLKLKACCRYRVRNYIRKRHRMLEPLYQDIYDLKDFGYWSGLKEQIETYCVENSIDYRLYFGDDVKEIDC